MASSNYDFDDQTDEDFFDKLVDGELDDSESNTKEISRDLSNLSIESDFSKNNESLKSGDAKKNDDLILAKSISEIEIGIKSDLQKQSSVEEVLGGPFSVDSSNECEKSTTFDCLRFSVENPNVFEESLAKNVSLMNEYSKSDDTEKNDSLAMSNNYSGLEFEAKSGLSEQTSVKEVQWGTFSGDSLDEIERNPISDNSVCLVDNVSGGFVGSTSENISPNVVLAENQHSSATEHLNNNDLILEKSVSVDSNGVEVDTKSNASKATCVKEVKWSDFNANDSQDFENIHDVDSFESYPAPSTENSNDFVDKISSSVDNQYDYSNSGEYTADQNDPQYWENLYPGWKFDSSSGQWYQVDNGTATADIQLDNLNVASADTVFVNSDASYNMHHPSLSVLQTTKEENSVTGNINFNTDSQGIVNYPPQMVFDPQYPGWYYDTNKQEWYTLESYSHGVNGNSDTVEDPSPEQNNSLYCKAREEGRQEFGHSWDASMSCYNQKNDLDNNSISQSQQTINKDWGSQESSQEWGNHDEQNHFFSNINQSEKQIDQNIASKAYAQAQQSMWLPQPLRNHKEDVTLSNSYYSDQPMINFSEQSYNGANTYNQSETQINQNIPGESNVHQSMWQPQPLQSHIEDASLSKSNYGATSNFSQQSFNGANTYYQSEKQTSQNTATKANAQQSMWQPQPLKNHIKDANLSKSNYGDQATVSYSQSPFNGAIMYDQSEKQANQNIGGSTYAQQNTWQPQPLKSHIEDASKSNYGDQATINYSQQSYNGANIFSTQFSNEPIEGRSSAGRPPHTLVTFGFGGKLLTMKDATGSSFGSVNQVNGSNMISVHNLPEVVTEKRDYFTALCQSSFAGPLVGGNAALKDVYKWLDEKIGKDESSTTDFQNTKSMKMLYSLLKIMCRHYGKLRSPFGADLSLETDGPDAAVTELFASAKKDGTQLTEFGSLTHCVHNIPSEGQIQATAIEVQKLLVSGKRKEALQYAQEGQLWGPALVLASQIGDNFYVDTVKKMAECQFLSGAPLRTLCLLIAGKPTDIFSNNSYSNSFYGASMGNYGSSQVPANSILDDWEENLAIISANRTKDDELVIIHLGDCLYKERAEIIPAHVCYLLAEANFELYSDSARLCLIGADHWKCPRTYASPEAIQRTEVYEYSKVLGNSQFLLLSLQPYKLIYAYMLAEVGKVSDSLRYCQSLQKSLKNPGQAPEIEIWRASLSSLEERLRTHQQGGYSSNLAPAKLVGKLFNSLDRSINRMIGSPQPTVPLMPQNSANIKDNFFNPASKVATSQSTLDVASLTPSASVEAISQWSSSGNTTSTHNRSISEPEFGRTSEPTPSKDTKDARLAKVQSKPSDTSSKIGRIGSQLFQKTIGWVSKSRQAKLGESNKFYYDEKLKRWVEEGAEPPAEEITPPPPPKVPTFQNGASNYDISHAFRDNSPPNVTTEKKSTGSSELNLGIPPIPPTQNQFSARGRMGVRSRYVDTFNKGASNYGSGMAKSSFQSPIAPSVKPAVNTKFFVPTPPSPSNDDQQNDTVKEVTQESVANTELLSSSSSNETTFSSPPPPPSSLQKFPSMDNIPHTSSYGVTGHSSYNRAVSWSGVYPDTSNRNPQSTPSSDGRILGEELQEVEL